MTTTVVICVELRFIRAKIEVKKTQRVDQQYSTNR